MTEELSRCSSCQRYVCRCSAPTEAPAAPPAEALQWTPWWWAAFAANA